MAADLRFAAALRAVADALDELGVPSMIIGGIAVIVAGVPRDTIDIDATVLGREADLDRVIEVFGKHGVVPRIPNARQFARERQVLLLVHEESGVTSEVAFAWLPFEEEALSRALEVHLEGVSFRVARPEDLIVYKAAAWRDRDRSDIERLLVLHLADIDLERVRKLITAIGSALDDPRRIEFFDRLVARARESGDGGR